MPTYNRYEKWQKYVNGQPTQEFRKGDLLGEDEWYANISDCEDNALYKWEESSTDWYCVSYSSYYKIYQYKSIDRGVTWTKTGEFRQGSLREQYDVACGWELKEEWQLTSYEVSGVDEVWAYMRSWDMGDTWEETGEFKYYRWADDVNEYECDNYTSYYIAYWMESSSFEKEEDTWEDPDTLNWQRAVPQQSQRGSMKELRSRECGWILMARWIDTGDTTCNGPIKQKIYRKEISLDMGETWEWTDDYINEDVGPDGDCILSSEPLTYSITLNSPTTTVQLDTTKSSITQLWIDWGEGAGPQDYSLVSGNFKHTYLNAGTYIIKWYGIPNKIGSVLKAAGGNDNDTYSIVSWGTAIGETNESLTTEIFDDEFPPSTFYGSHTTYNLPKTVDLTSDNNLILGSLTANHSDALQYVERFICSGEITDLAGQPLPVGMFDYAENLKWSIFQGTGLTEVPARFYANTKQVLYINTFAQCTELTKIGLNCIGPDNVGIADTSITSGIDWPIINPKDSRLYLEKGEHTTNQIRYSLEEGNFYDPAVYKEKSLDEDRPGFAYSPTNEWRIDLQLSLNPMPEPCSTAVYSILALATRQNDLDSSTMYFAFESNAQYWRRASDTIYCQRTFYECIKLSDISEDPINRGINFGCANQMFASCVALRNVPSSLLNFSTSNARGVLRRSGDASAGFYLDNTYRQILNITGFHVFDGRAMFMNSGVAGEISISATDDGDSQQFYDFSNMFRSCPNITKVTWTSDFVDREVGRQLQSAQYTRFALAFCENLEEVSIQGVSYPDYMCAGDTKLTTAYIRTADAERTFWECTALTSVTGEIYLSANATFEGCTALTNIPFAVIQNCYITNATFYKCTGFNYLDPIRKFGKYPYLTFLDCLNLDVSNYNPAARYPATNETQDLFQGLRTTLAFAECKNIMNQPITFGGCVHPDYSTNDYYRTKAGRLIVGITSTQGETLLNSEEYDEVQEKAVLYGINPYLPWGYKCASNTYGGNSSQYEYGFPAQADRYPLVCIESLFDRYADGSEEVLLYENNTQVHESTNLGVLENRPRRHTNPLNTVAVGANLSEVVIDNNPSGINGGQLYNPLYYHAYNIIVTGASYRPNGTNTYNSGGLSYRKVEQFNDKIMKYYHPYLSYYQATEENNLQTRTQWLNYVTNDKVEMILDRFKADLQTRTYPWYWMNRAFFGCLRITELPDLSYWTQDLIGHLGQYMFAYCENLVTIPHLWNSMVGWSSQAIPSNIFLYIGHLSSAEKDLIKQEMLNVYGNDSDLGNTPEARAKEAAHRWGFTDYNECFPE